MPSILLGKYRLLGNVMAVGLAAALLGCSSSGVTTARVAGFPALAEAVTPTDRAIRNAENLRMLRSLSAWVAGANFGEGLGLKGGGSS